MSEPTACIQHVWRWLDAPVFRPGGRTGLAEAVNASCERCGARSWQHGSAPNAAPVIGQIVPTTERS
jgi:hypothetical protein